MNFVDLALLRWEVGSLLQKLHFFLHRNSIYQNKAINENFVDLALLRWEVGPLLQKLHFFGTVLIFLTILEYNGADQMTYTVVKIIFSGIFQKKKKVFRKKINDVTGV